MHWVGVPYSTLTDMDSAACQNFISVICLPTQNIFGAGNTLIAAVHDQHDARYENDILHTATLEISDRMSWITRSTAALILASDGGSPFSRF
jgi:hypothetical protein